jgi:hypothetical protein
MNLRALPLPELNIMAYDILCRELGVPQAMRVFRQMGLGSGNYTEERHAWLDDVTEKDFQQALARLNETRAKVATD